jgi:hypothetical protein
VAEPDVDRGDLDGGFVADGELLVANGDGTVLLEQVDAALDGVSAAVGGGVERWGRPPREPFALR